MATIQADTEIPLLRQIVIALGGTGMGDTEVELLKEWLSLCS